MCCSLMSVSPFGHLTWNTCLYPEDKRSATSVADALFRVLMIDSGTIVQRC